MYFTLRDACGGVHAFGGIGSGKTSATLKMFMREPICAPVSGLVDCREIITRYLSGSELKQDCMAGAIHSCSLMKTEGFNFLDLPDVDEPRVWTGIGTSVDCLHEHHGGSAKRASPTASKTRRRGRFGKTPSRKGLRYTLPPIYSAKGSLSIPDIIRFISTAPTSRQETTDPAWQERSFFYQIMNAAANRPKVPDVESCTSERD